MPGGQDQKFISVILEPIWSEIHYVTTVKACVPV